MKIRWTYPANYGKVEILFHWIILYYGIIYRITLIAKEFSQYTEITALGWDGWALHTRTRQFALRCHWLWRLVYLAQLFIWWLRKKCLPLLSIFFFLFSSRNNCARAHTHTKLSLYDNFCFCFCLFRQKKKKQHLGGVHFIQAKVQQLEYIAV